MKPYYEHNGFTIYHGDCRELVLDQSVDVIIADPPYAQTSLKWDKWATGWTQKVLPVTRQLWCFGSLRMFMLNANEFQGWRLSQDLVWQKQNGSSFHADRFRRVHEQIAHFYHGEWCALTINPVKVLGGRKKTIRAKRIPPHMGIIDGNVYISEDGGPRLLLSILKHANCHGFAEHPTQKPVAIIRPLIEYSTNPGDCVFSPFLGSGSDLVAAKELGRIGIGVDLDERCCEIAARRLEQEVLSLCTPSTKSS